MRVSKTGDNYWWLKNILPSERSPCTAVSGSCRVAAGRWTYCGAPLQTLKFQQRQICDAFKHLHCNLAIPEWKMAPQSFACRLHHRHQTSPWRGPSTCRKWALSPENKKFNHILSMYICVIYLFIISRCPSSSIQVVGSLSNVNFPLGLFWLSAYIWCNLACPPI